MSDNKVYEMLWDCKYCGTTKLLGKTHRFCPNCGASQDSDSRYFPSDAEKVAVQDHKYYGVDKTCAACSALNGALAEFCAQCGSPLSEAVLARRLDEQTRAEHETFESSGSRDLAKERFDAEMRRIGVQPAPDSKRGLPTWAMIGLVALVVIIVGGVLAALLWKREEAFYVTGHTWERAIEIEQYRPRYESAWCDSMPLDAYGISSEQRQRGSRQVPDGEDCRVVRSDQGDGTFVERTECTPRYRDEPIYDDYCTYSVNRWGYERAVRAQGSSLDDPLVWPQTDIRRTGTCLGCEREGRRLETFSVTLRAGDDKTYTCAVPFDRWQTMPVESTWKMDVGVITGQPDCRSLEPTG